MERILPPLPFSSSAVLPRLDGLGRYNRAIRRELAAMGMDKKDARWWAQTIANLAHGRQISIYGHADAMTPECVRPLLVRDGSTIQLSQAGRAWLEMVKRNG